MQKFLHVLKYTGVSTAFYMFDILPSSLEQQQLRPIGRTTSKASSQEVLHHVSWRGYFYVLKMGCHWPIFDETGWKMKKTQRSKRADDQQARWTVQ